MNRQTRRRLARQGVKVDEVKRMQEQAEKDAIAFAVEQYSAVVALCLRDKLGFGKVRAQRFMGQVDEMFDSINKGYLTLDDVLETVEEELGIRIR